MTDTTPALDLDAITEKWLRQCGACDAGLGMSCTCPPDDPRNVIDALVEAVATLRRELAEARDALAEIKGRRILSVVFGHHKGAPRPFALYRPGRVLVALGSEFPDGAVALRLANDGGWTTKSDGGAEQFADSEVVWLSDELGSLAEMERELDEAVAEAATLRRDLAEARAETERLRADDQAIRHALREHGTGIGGYGADPLALVVAEHLDGTRRGIDQLEELRMNVVMALCVDDDDEERSDEQVVARVRELVTAERERDEAVAETARVRTAIAKIADSLAVPPPVVHGTAQGAYRYVAERLRAALDGAATPHLEGRPPVNTLQAGLGDDPYGDTLRARLNCALHHGPGAIDMLTDATARFNRIAGAHGKDVDEHGGTTGDCRECGHVWPCPTYVWATSDRDPLATWDPADDEPAPGREPTGGGA